MLTGCPQSCSGVGGSCRTFVCREELLMQIMAGMVVVKRVITEQVMGPFSAGLVFNEIYVRIV